MHWCCAHEQQRRVISSVRQPTVCRIVMQSLRYASSAVVVCCHCLLQVTDVGKHAVDETRTRIKRMLAAARVTSAALAAEQQAQLSSRHVSGSISAQVGVCGAAQGASIGGGELCIGCCSWKRAVV
jgi:hypothetical protein